MTIWEESKKISFYNKDKKYKNTTYFSDFGFSIETFSIETNKKINIITVCDLVNETPGLNNGFYCNK